MMVDQQVDDSRTETLTQQSFSTDFEKTKETEKLLISETAKLPTILNINASNDSLYTESGGYIGAQKTADSSVVQATSEKTSEKTADINRVGYNERVGEDNSNNHNTQNNKNDNNDHYPNNRNNHVAVDKQTGVNNMPTKVPSPDLDDKTLGRKDEGHASPQQSENSLPGGVAEEHAALQKNSFPEEDQKPEEPEEKSESQKGAAEGAAGEPENQKKEQTNVEEETPREESPEPPQEDSPQEDSPQEAPPSSLLGSIAQFHSLILERCGDSIESLLNCAIYFSPNSDTGYQEQVSISMLPYILFMIQYFYLHEQYKLLL